jgi:creatinine amidohydrolase
MRPFELRPVIEMVKLYELTWRQAKKAFQETSTAIIPTGSNEQHGPHLPLGTDWIVANEIANRLSDKTKAIVLPVVPYGYAEYHMDFPGTIYLDKETFRVLLMDMCRSLNRWGISRILFVNGHGGNMDTLHTVSMKIRKKYGMLAAAAQWWEMLPQKIGGEITETHGGTVETAIVRTINPNIVDMAVAFVPKVKSLTNKIETISIVQSRFEDGLMRIYYRVGDVSEAGSMTETEGATDVKDFSTATPELGKELLDKVVNQLAKFIPEFEKIEVPKTQEEP